MKYAACALALSLAAGAAHAKPFGDYYVDCVMTYPTQEHDTPATRANCEKQAEKMKAAETAPDPNSYDEPAKALPPDNGAREYRPGALIVKATGALFVGLVMVLGYSAWRFVFKRRANRPSKT